MHYLQLYVLSNSHIGHFDPNIDENLMVPSDVIIQRLKIGLTSTGLATRWGGGVSYPKIHPRLCLVAGAEFCQQAGRDEA
jgi:hypothetical protein